MSFLGSNWQSSQQPWSTGLDTYRPSTLPTPFPGELTDQPTAAARAGAIVCGNPNCTRGWTLRLKNRRRPMFEGKWACGTSCLSAMVASALRREAGEGHAAASEHEHRHRVPLGLVLLSQGWITHPQLQHALALQRRTGAGRIGEILMQEYGVPEARITHALCTQWNCPALTPDRFEPSAMALAMPRIFVEHFGLLPLRVAARRILYLGFADRMDADAAFAIERMCGLKVESGLVDESRFHASRQRLLECDFVETKRESASDAEDLSAKLTAAIAETKPRASRLVKIHQFYWLRMWLESAAITHEDAGIPASREDVVDRVYTLGMEQ